MPVYNQIEDTTTSLAAPGNNISNWTVDDIKRSDILVFRENTTDYVDAVVAPNGFQVGLLDEAFLTDLLVTGHITGSGVIYSELGFSGSLQTLVDGTDYLRGGAGIQISNNNDGSITITNTGGGGGGVNYTAGSGLSLIGSIFDVETDGDTIIVDSNNDLAVQKVPNLLTAGSGLVSTSFDGSQARTLTVQAVAGTPITVTAAGVGMDITNLGALSLSATDEILIQQGGTFAKSTIQDILDLAPAGGGTNDTGAAYLVAQSSTSLSNERVLVGGNGIDVVDNSGLGNMSVSVALESNGGLEFVSGKLAVKIADFIGFGLSEENGKIRIDTNALAGLGLTVDGNQLAVDFGSGNNSAVRGSNTLSVNAGDGLSLGGTATLGNASSNINLEVRSEDIGGLGTSISNNNINVFLGGSGGISILSGSSGELVIDAAGVTGQQTTIDASSGISATLDSNTNEYSVVVDYDANDNVITSAPDPVQNWTIDDVNDKILIYDNSEQQVVKIPAESFTAGAGKIGDPEDGAWNDGSGVWNDFTNDTPTGTAIDRINEFLKGLAPSSASNVSTITTSTGSGAGVRLSFGAANAVATHTDVSALGNFTVLDVNGNYSVSTNTDQRLGAFGTTAVVQGVVNGGASGDGSNYPANAFGNADQGSLVLEVNGATAYTLDLTLNSTGAGAAGSGTGNHLASDTGFYNVSAATNGQFPSGESFDQFKHRTASWRVGIANQREGWNYAKVSHIIGSTTYASNHVQWLNDSTGAAAAITLSNNAISNLSLAGTKYLSGVNYYTAGTLDYACDVENFYSFVYGTNNIVVSSPQTNNVNVAPSTINTGNGEDHTKDINIDESLTINSNKLLNESVNVSLNVIHPLKNNVNGGGSSSVNNILLYNIAEANTSTLNISENFNGESFRMIVGDYNNQTDVADAANIYDSTVSLVGNTALQVWNQRLVWPNQSTNGGDFSTIANGPAGNVDYSGITAGERTYYRKFVNPGSSQSNFGLTIQGSSTISTATNPSGNNIKVFIKLPQTPTNDTTGWLDITVPFATNQYSDGDGCLLGQLDNTLNATNRLTVGVNSVGNNESIIIKIVAASDWTGHISNMSISWG